MVEDHQAAPASVERENSLYLSRCLTHRVASRTSSIAANRQELVIPQCISNRARGGCDGREDREGVTETPEGQPKDLGRSPANSSQAIVAILLGASGVLIWYEYYRHWDIQDLEDAVLVRDESLGPFLDGFDTDLAGRTVTVEVEIDGVRTLQTSMGQLNLISPKDGEHVTLMMWGPLEYDVGDRIEVEVRFEWATINGNEGVYSPQSVDWQLDSWKRFRKSCSRSAGLIRN